MKEIEEFDNAPYGEEVIQPSENYSYFEGKKQALALINQLERLCGKAPVGSYFKSKVNREWQGTRKVEWISVLFSYDKDNNEHMNYYESIEVNFPEYWDEIALKELQLVR